VLDHFAEVPHSERIVLNLHGDEAVCDAPSAGGGRRREFVTKSSMGRVEDEMILATLSFDHVGEFCLEWVDHPRKPSAAAFVPNVGKSGGPSSRFPQRAHSRTVRPRTSGLSSSWRR